MGCVSGPASLDGNPKGSLTRNMGVGETCLGGNACVGCTWVQKLRRWF